MYFFIFFFCIFFFEYTIRQMENEESMTIKVIKKAKKERKKLQSGASWRSSCVVGEVDVCFDVLIGPEVGLGHASLGFVPRAASFPKWRIKPAQSQALEALTQLLVAQCQAGLVSVPRLACKTIYSFFWALFVPLGKRSGLHIGVFLHLFPNQVWWKSIAGHCTWSNFKLLTLLGDENQWQSDSQHLERLQI